MGGGLGEGDLRKGSCRVSLGSLLDSLHCTPSEGEVEIKTFQTGASQQCRWRNTEDENCNGGGGVTEV